MNDVLVVSIIRQGLTTVLMVAGPMLGVGLVVGLLVSIFQATTQIQEQTLTFIPKIVSIFLTLVVLGSWMLRILVQFTTEIFAYIPQAVSW